MAELAYVVLGSNLEPRLESLHSAVDRLCRLYPTDFCCSSWYESQPFLGLKQPPFINGACQFSVSISALELLGSLLEIEQQLGRVRGVRWGNRTVDLDLALFGQQIIDTSGLVVPHYDLLSRDFFLVPLLELNPKLRDPHSGKPLADLLDHIPEGKRTALKILS